MEFVLNYVQIVNLLLTVFLFPFALLILWRLIKERSIIKKASLRELNQLLMLVFFTLSSSAFLQSTWRILFVSGIYTPDPLQRALVTSISSLVINTLYLYTIIQVFRYQKRK